MIQNTARCKRQKQYQHNHDGRIIQKEECAKRVQVRKENRHIKYLETAPNLRSAQKGLKKKLIIESEDIDGYVCCYYCGKCIKTDDSNLHFEHKKPVARGGKNNLANLELACASCNLSKGQKTEAEFREAGNI